MKPQIMIMKNWSPFHTYIQNMYEEYDQKRIKEIDPYKQLALDGIKNTISAVERDYRNYLLTIGDDNGITFLKLLNDSRLDLRAKSSLESRSYMRKVYLDSEYILHKITSHFEKFRTEE